MSDRPPGLAHPPSWADAWPPPPGAWCRCCWGGRFWTERWGSHGWRCMTCHSPDHLTADAVGSDRDFHMPSPMYGSIHPMVGVKNNARVNVASVSGTRDGRTIARSRGVAAMSPEAEARRAARRIGLLAVQTSERIGTRHNVGLFQLIAARDGEVIAGQAFDLAPADVVELCEAAATKRVPGSA
jgi:hypothetical protein